MLSNGFFIYLKSEKKEINEMKKIKIFDTTLRDGEQTPRVNLNKEDKVTIAKQLEILGVDVIEAGFPISSEGDFQGVKAVAEAVEKPVVCALARCVKEDILAAANALESANHKRIHVFLATSPIHLKDKLNLTEEEAVRRAVEMVAFAKSLVGDIQFSAEDATRSDKDFLCRIFGEVIKAGATTLNIPDTVGFIQPHEYGAFIKYIKDNTKGIEKAVIAVHCHDDLGMATSNALAGVLGGAGQIECTINGLGERAGNTALEESVMAINTRSDLYKVETDIVTEELYKTSKLVTALTGAEIAPTKSIVGDNCFLHESGIHQDGIIKNRRTYEIMDPQKIGIPQNDGLILGKHSGRRAFKAFLAHSGVNVNKYEEEEIFYRFKKLTDEKKYISTGDIMALVEKENPSEKDYKFISYVSKGLEEGLTQVQVKISKGQEEMIETAQGNGQVDAAYKAINKMVNKPVELLDYWINAISGKSDAQGEARVRVKLYDKEINTWGLDGDIVKASILAYIQGINKLESDI